LALKYSTAHQHQGCRCLDTSARSDPFFSIQGISRQTFGYLHTGLRTMVEHGYNALAIDEHRKDFARPSGLFASQGREDFTAPPETSRASSSVGSSEPMRMSGRVESDLLAQITPVVDEEGSLHGWRQERR